MKHFIATFDIETAPGEPRERLVEAALARGWSNVIVVAGQSTRLPSAALVGDFAGPEEAQRAFDAAIADASAMMAPAKVAVERRYIVERVPAGRVTTRKSAWVKTNIARLNTLLKPKRRD